MTDFVFPGDEMKATLKQMLVEASQMSDAETRQFAFDLIDLQASSINCKADFDNLEIIDLEN